MFDLSAPCNKIELHLLTKLLDKQNEEVIEYAELQNGLKFVRYHWLSLLIDALNSFLINNKTSSKQVIHLIMYSKIDIKTTFGKNCIHKYIL